MTEGRESVLNSTSDLQKLLTYAKGVKIFYKVVQVLEDTDKSFQSYIWNLEQRFAYDERARITETLQCEVFGVASPSSGQRRPERYLLSGAILLLALTSLILQVQQFLTSDRMLAQTLISIKNQLAAIQDKKEEKVNALLQAKVQNLISGAFAGGDGGHEQDGETGRLAGLLWATIGEKGSDGRKDPAEGQPEEAEGRGSGAAARSLVERDAKLVDTVSGQVPEQEQTRMAKSLFRSILSSDTDRVTTRKSQAPSKEPLLRAGARIRAQNKLQIKKYRNAAARPEDPTQPGDDRPSQGPKYNELLKSQLEDKLRKSEATSKRGTGFGAGVQSFFKRDKALLRSQASEERPSLGPSSRATKQSLMQNLYQGIAKQVQDEQKVID